VEGNRISGANLSVTDIAPTLLQLAGVTQPATFNGHPILPYEGHSLVPLLEGKVTAVRGPDEVLGYELFYRRGLRKGDWKVVYLPQAAAAYGKQNVGDGVWHLYNLASDPGETTDLSASQPEKLKELIAAWNAYAAAHQVVLPAAK
jgi:arylsulfatase